MGACVPEEYGGGGVDFLSYILVLEELSRADAGVGVTVAVHTSAVHAADPHVRHRRAAGAVRAAARAAASVLGAFALTEAEAGSDAGSLRTAADARRRRLDDHRREAVDHERTATPARSCSSRARITSTPGARGVSRVRARRRARARDPRRGEARAQLVRRPNDIVIEGARRRARPAAPRGGPAASASRWRRSTAAASGSRRRRSASRRPRYDVARALRAERRAFGQRDRGASRRSSTSSPTCPRRSTRPACSSTGRRG